MYVCVYVLKTHRLAQRVNQAEAQLLVDMEYAAS
jgi:hypothetical protein